MSRCLHYVMCGNLCSAPLCDGCCTIRDGLLERGGYARGRESMLRDICELFASTDDDFGGNPFLIEEVRKKLARKESGK